MSEQERKPLSEREYFALRQLFGVVSIFGTNAPDLEKRVRGIPGGWRDLRLIMTLSEKLMGNILRTVPLNKLKMIQKELKNITCETKVNMDVTGRKSEGFCYVPDSALVNTVERLMNWECAFCEKSGADVKHCPIRKDLETLYPWDFPLKGETCPLAGMSIEKED